ncbi:MarR family winged helix-turn-helix transcriptional regulator [Granulicella sibirica]|uniref:MarR family winged helix-turn-helix transcriptional regulator n=1 Tax=Granulicella sibirica TaxID=2479048 RepID=UPI0030C81138
MYSSNKPDSIPCTCTTVKKLSRVLGKSYDAALSEAGINITQLAVLRCISRRSGEPLSHVADELEMDRTSLYRAIAPMERDGWISIEDGNDARSRTAKLLRKGNSVLKKADKGWDEIQSKILGRFGKDEWLTLVSALNRLADCALD